MDPESPALPGALASIILPKMEVTLLRNNSFSEREGFREH